MMAMYILHANLIKREKGEFPSYCVLHSDIITPDFTNTKVTREKAAISLFDVDELTNYCQLVTVQW